jgi:hypothetical protein
MYSRDCLIIIWLAFWPNEEFFDTQALALKLRQNYQLYSLVTRTPGQPIPVLIKRLSDDLIRLHNMGFLRGRKVAREVKTSTGKNCNRGTKILHKLSKMGKDEFSYILNPESHKDNHKRKIQELEDPRDDILNQYLKKRLSNIPPDVMELLSDSIATRKGGRYNRFRRKIDRSLVIKYAISRYLLHKAGPEFEKEFFKLETALNIVYGSDDDSNGQSRILEGLDRNFDYTIKLLTDIAAPGLKLSLANFGLRHQSIS